MFKNKINNKTEIETINVRLLILFWMIIVKFNSLFKRNKVIQMILTKMN